MRGNAKKRYAIKNKNEEEGPHVGRRRRLGGGGGGGVGGGSHPRRNLEQKARVAHPKETGIATNFKSHCPHISRAGSRLSERTKRKARYSRKREVQARHNLDYILTRKKECEVELQPKGR